jgi:hypothetical protein
MNALLCVGWYLVGSGENAAAGLPDIMYWLCNACLTEGIVGYRLVRNGIIKEQSASGELNANIWQPCSSAAIKRPRLRGAAEGRGKAEQVQLAKGKRTDPLSYLRVRVVRADGQAVLILSWEVVGGETFFTSGLGPEVVSAPPPHQSSNCRGGSSIALRVPLQSWCNEQDICNTALPPAYVILNNSPEE